MASSHTYYLAEPGLDGLVAALDDRFSLSTDAATESTVTLLDSFDWRLYKGGIELQYAEHRLSAVPLQADSPLDRPPQRPLQLDEAPAFAEDLPPGILRETLSDLLSVRRLLPVVTWKRRQSILRFLDRRQKTVVRGSISTLNVGATQETLLQLQPVRGYDSQFARLHQVLEDHGVCPCDRTEGFIAATAARRCPGAYSNQVQLELHRETRADLTMRLIHGRLREIAVANIPGIRAALDIEFLHDFRVALRKSRSGLAQVRHVFPDPIVAHFKEELRWLFRQTGYQRDLDVFLLAMPGYHRLLPADSQEDLTPLKEFLEVQRDSERKRLDQLLGSRRVRQLFAAWGQFLDSELPTDDRPVEAAEPIAEVARRTVLRLWTRVLRDGKRIGPDEPDVALHALRVQIKKLRYMLEFFRDVLSEEATQAIGETKRLQENLGRFADFSVQRGHLQRFASDLSATERASPATLLAMGQLLPQFEAGQARERRRFRRTFDRFSSRANQQMMTRILA